MCLETEDHVASETIHLRDNHDLEASGTGISPHALEVGALTVGTGEIIIQIHCFHCNSWPSAYLLLAFYEVEVVAQRFPEQL